MKFLIFAAVLIFSAFAVSVDVKNPFSFMNSVASSSKVRSVSFTPAPLPCGFMIAAYTEMVSITSTGVTRTRSIGNLTKMDNIMSTNVIMADPEFEYYFKVVRFDLAYKEKGADVIPGLEAHAIPLSTQDCKFDYYSVDEAYQEINSTLQMFTETATYDSYAPQMFRGKKYMVYTVANKHPNGVEYQTIYVDDKNYIAYANVTFVGSEQKERMEVFGTFTYVFEYTLDKFVPSRKIFGYCNESFSEPPATNPCDK